MKPEAKQFQEYFEQSREEVDLRFYCKKVGGMCIQKNCDKYDSCTKPAKENFASWKKAYNDDRRTVLQQLAEGGMINGN